MVRMCRWEDARRHCGILTLPVIWRNAEKSSDRDGTRTLSIHIHAGFCVIKYPTEKANNDSGNLAAVVTVFGLKL